MRKFLGEILMEMEVCSEPEISAALQKQMDGDGRPIGEILCEMEACNPEDVARALSQQHELRFVDLDALEIPQSVVEMIPLDLAAENNVMPVSMISTPASMALRWVIEDMPDVK